MEINYILTIVKLLNANHIEKCLQNPRLKKGFPALFNYFMDIVLTFVKKKRNLRNMFTIKFSSKIISNSELYSVY